MTRPTPLPDGRLVAWYGDDFTGAAAVMEVLSFAGLESVLFFAPPTVDQLSRFPNARGIGIAGTARARSPAWMEASLPPVFKEMAKYGAAINHYKICSTLDSSAQLGSIGRAIELGIPLLAEADDWHAFLVAAPAIQRYQAFGNLFAGASGMVYRLDRHPVMCRHPVTPMDEADVRLHLEHQTRLPIGLVSIADLNAGKSQAALLRERHKDASIVAIDCMDESSLAEVGRLIWENHGRRHFCIGSQGIEYALVAYWRQVGLLDEMSPAASPGRVERMAVVSGSCSSVNAQQIAVAATQGFEAIRIDPSKAVDAAAWKHELQKVSALALSAIDNGFDPLMYTSTGPEDPANSRFLEAIDTAGLRMSDVNEDVGSGLGALLLDVIERAEISRCAIAGGDTSGHGASMLGLYALTALAPIATGAALCQAHSEKQSLANLQISLKGGQMGEADFFQQVRNGGLTA